MTDGQRVDKWFDALIRISAAESHLDSAREYEHSARPRCGNCSYWMTDGCPRESHVNGWRKGPNCNGFSCDKYVEAFSVESLRELAQAEKGKALAVLESGA